EIERTLLRGTWLWMQRSQWFALQIQVAWQTSVAATWQGRGRTFLMPLPPLPSERRTLLQTLLAREYKSQSTTFWRTGVLRHSTRSLLRELTRHTLATMVVERATAPGAKSQLQVDASTATRRARAAEPELLPLLKRVLQQNRRIEEQVVPSQTVLLRPSAPPAREAHFLEAAPAPQARPTGMNTAWMAMPIQPGFNINQITD